MSFLQESFNKKIIPSKSLRDLETSLVNIRCFYVQNKHVYSFQNLENDQGDYITDYSSDSGENGKLYYNFCRNTLKTCPAEEGEEQKQSTIIYENGEKCIRLSGSIEGGEDGKNIWQEFVDISETENKTGLTLSLAPGDYCNADKTERYQIIYKMYCNNDLEKKDFKLNFESFNPNNCTTFITGEAYDACTVNNLLRLRQFIEEKKVIIGIVIIAMGIFLVGLGAKVFKVVVVLICGLICSIVCAIMAFSLFMVETEKQFWMVILIPFAIGLLLGCLLLKSVRSAVFMQGASAGYPIGIALYDLVLKYIDWEHTDILYWIVIGACCIAFGLLALLFLKVTIIISTSIVGGYMVIKGASFFIGYFPDETQLVELIKAKEYEQLDELLTYHVYIYLTVWLILSIFGMCIQFKITKDLTDKDFSGENEEKGYKKMKE
ncbi:MAG: TMEM198/TM7SF3 family protein [archaeon]|nr:TMEM198/TM7SF3 family protein [archaeon]